VIDPLACIDPTAVLHEGVKIGPWTQVGAGVEIGAGTEVGPHVVIQGSTRIGRNNRISPFCAIGGDPQDKKFVGEADSRLEIGDDNTIREFCTINRGTGEGGGITRVGDRNWIMAYVHIAHDCLIGSDTIFSNSATLGGHVVVEDHASVAGCSAIHQFCRIGAYAFVGGGAMVTHDVPPFVLVFGYPAVPAGLNREGLKRRGFAAADQAALRQAYRFLYRQDLPFQEALARIADLAEASPPVARMVEFLRGSTRGIIRKAQATADDDE
jgi:UDP-N-acetylglucosamine acyltransferase